MNEANFSHYLLKTFELKYEVDEMSTRTFWERSGKSKLPPRSGSNLEAVEPHP